MEEKVKAAVLLFACSRDFFAGRRLGKAVRSGQLIGGSEHRTEEATGTVGSHVTGVGFSTKAVFNQSVIALRKHSRS
jgi:hypothetical protein